jgi:hypothetical protein
VSVRPDQADFMSHLKSRRISLLQSQSMAPASLIYLWTLPSLGTTSNSSREERRLRFPTPMWTSTSSASSILRSVPVSKPKCKRSEMVSGYVARLTLGFSRVLSVRDLALFAPEELILLFGNAEEDWSRESESPHHPC